ncbi:MAG: hypothetical protein AAGU12_09805 [Clostridiales bacterium]
MSSLAVIISLCTVGAVGIVYFFTDNIALSLLVLACGLALAFYLDRKWRLEKAEDKVRDQDKKDREKVLEELDKLEDYKNQVDCQDQGAMVAAVDNIYQVSYHLLHDSEIDLSFIYQVGLYIPRINKILDTYLSKSADGSFKDQSREFMIRTSDAFSKLLAMSSVRDIKEAESLMQALDETYRLHGLANKDGGVTLL